MPANLQLTIAKLKQHCSLSYGSFHLSNVIESTSLKEQTAKSHINQLLIRGLITQQSFQSDPYKRRYRLVKQRGKYIQVELSKFSHKNIAAFRALITEAKISVYKDSQKKIIKSNIVKELKLQDYNKNYIKKLFKKGSTAGIKLEDQLGKTKNYVANTLSAKIANKSISTIQRYKKLQTVSTYSWKPIEYIPCVENEIPIFDVNFGKIVENTKTGSFYLSLPCERISQIKVRFKKERNLINNNILLNTKDLTASSFYTVQSLKLSEIPF